MRCDRLILAAALLSISLNPFVFALADRLYEHYCELRRDDPAFDREAFGVAYAILGAQRATKILGIFARLSKRDGKHGYLNDIPLVLRYLLARLVVRPVETIAAIAQGVSAGNWTPSSAEVASMSAWAARYSRSLKCSDPFSHPAFVSVVRGASVGAGTSRSVHCATPSAFARPFTSSVLPRPGRPSSST